jgi:hypothetical protein
MKRFNVQFFTLILIFCISARTQAATTGWAKSFGGTADENFSVTAKDANGNLFVATRYFGTCDFDPNPNKTAYLTASGPVSVGISKFDANGNFLWVKGVTGPLTEVKALTIDKEGNILFGGFFGTNAEGTATTDFNPDPLQATALLPGYFYSDVQKRNLFFNDGYVCKWDNNGNFIWVKQFTGALNEEVNELKTDEENNVILTGDFYGFAGVTVDCDPDPNKEFKLVANTDDGAQFITKLDAEGKFVWAKKLDGTGPKYITDIDTDNTNNVYFSGYYNSTMDADPGVGVVTFTASGMGSDMFVLKLDMNGDFVFAKSFGGVSQVDYLSSINVDKQSGEIYVGGSFTGSMSIDNVSVTSKGSNDPFIAKLDALGVCVWAKNWGGVKYDTFNNMDRDDAGNIFTTGMFSGTADMNPAAAELIFTSAGNYDAYINKFDNEGNLVWAKQIGSMGNDWGNSVTAMGDGNVFATGAFTFEASIGFTGERLTSAGGYDVWMFKSSLTTDIKDNKLNANISLYPNPTQGQAVIDLNQAFSQMTVTIRNVPGAMVSTTNYSNISRINLNLQGESGLYFVELKNPEGQLQTIKVLKK